MYRILDFWLNREGATSAGCEEKTGFGNACNAQRSALRISQSDTFALKLSHGVLPLNSDQIFSLSTL